MPANFPDSPTLNQTYTYGAMTWQWTGSYWSVVESANYTAVTAITANLVPSVNEVYNLGSATLRWRDLYLSGNSLVLGAATISASGSAITLPANSSIGTTSFGSTSLTTEDLTVTGNLTVNGTTTTINSTTLSIDDKNIVLADGAANAAAADGAGITVAGASATLTYASASDSWNVNKNILITPGTANGVLYLNASKVATTGSALTFDGAQLGVNGITIGRGAGAVATNTALGVSALTTNSTGSDNTAVGHQSLYSNSTGIQLTAFGSGALYNTTANSSVGVGYQAGYANTTGRITAIGYLALTANTTGDWNSAFGRQALYVNTTGSYNTSVGVSALYSNTTASYNTALGYQAGYANTTGNSNTYLGWNTSAAGAGNTGSGNLAAGFNALNNNTSGTSNTALGGGIYAVMASALESNTTGNYNVAVGTAALKSNTTASNNTAVGYQAGYSNTTGGANTFIGRLAGYNNTTAGENTAIGNSALYWNTTGTYNVAIGTSALSTGAGSAGSNGDYNVAVGVSSLNANRASSNTALGYASGGSVTTGGGNTLIGNNAGAQLTTGTYNTYIGGGIVGSTGGAGFDVVNASKQTIIGRFSGNQGGLDIRGTNNYIVLSDGDGNPRLAINGTEWLLAAGGTSTTGDVISNGGGNTSGYNGILIGANMRAITTQANTGLPSWLVDIGGRAADGTTYQLTTADKFRVVRVAAGGSFYGTQAAFEVNSNGCVGLNTSAASTGTGITFPATQLASSNANTLDDYEEGTWTPTVGGNAVMGIQAGDYIKIGKLVWINFDFSVVTLGTGSNRFITGLPFPFNGGQSARTAGSVNYFVNLASTASAYYLQVDGNGIYLDLNNAASSNITDGPVWIQSGTRIMGTIMYQTSN